MERKQLLYEDMVKLIWLCDITVLNSEHKLPPVYTIYRTLCGGIDQWPT